MAQRQAAQGIAGVAAALRTIAQQTGTWGARPLGSLITSQPSTSFAAAFQCEQVSPCRGMARGSPFTGFNPGSWFDYRKIVYPDVYDANESLLCDRYKTHGTVVERFQPPQPYTNWNPLLDPELERRVKYWHTWFWTSLVCYRSLWAYRKPQLQQRMLDAYKNVNAALATGDLSLAEPYVSEPMLQRLGGEIARRGRSTRVEWRLVGEPDPKDITFVHGAVVGNPMKQGRLSFVQWTARIPSKQVVAVYDARGRLLAGDPNKELDVVDYWVFERPILKAWVIPRPGPQGATWRLVDRLQV
ncbi:hypothetical protein Agub_g8313 [Astrephomene gubernaculifera]|uniref:Large ribosomal subunit protein mL45 n=1 Tax=Astrephomene gubernaculifera TaxID=47775 RepID=A0AAD3DRG2_9CHLO|nr:hypothetical protein Agub_g8313 [Astrephomene gubernaculifera]